MIISKKIHYDIIKTNKIFSRCRLYKFKLGVRLYVINIILIIVWLLELSQALTKSANFLIKVLCFSMTVLVLVNPINLIYSCTIIDSAGITQRSLYRKIHIPWDSVRIITQNSPNIFNKVSVGVYGANKKINITPYIRGYRKLIELILLKCTQNPETEIDSNIGRILKNI